MVSFDQEYIYNLFNLYFFLETEMLAVDLRSFKLNAESSDYFQDVELGGPTGFPGKIYRMHLKQLMI